MRTINIMRLAKSKLWMMGILFMLACSGQNDSQGLDAGDLGESPEDSSSQPLMSFLSMSHDFGTIIEGEMVVCYFDYENSGERELVIKSVETTCGCTTPDWSREPLKQGEKERLKIIFDAKGRSGAQRKVVTVASNASNSPLRLTIRANINSNVN